MHLSSDQPDPQPGGLAATQEHRFICKTLELVAGVCKCQGGRYRIRRMKYPFLIIPPISEAGHWCLSSPLDGQLQTNFMNFTEPLSRMRRDRAFWTRACLSLRLGSFEAPGRSLRGSHPRSRTGRERYLRGAESHPWVGLHGQGFYVTEHVGPSSELGRPCFEDEGHP